MASTATTFDTDCQWMLHGEGTDASTTITDSSPAARTTTANGNAQIDTAQFKFGSASMLFDGTNDYIDSADAASLEPASSDLTLDFQIRFNAFAGSTVYGILCKAISGGSGGFSMTFENNGVSANILFSINKSNSVLSASGQTIVTGTWYHFAVVRSGNNWYLFKDGVQIATASDSSSIADNGDSIKIGRGFFPNAGGWQSASVNDFNGWIDEVRYVIGTAVWTAGFTPPSAAYTLLSSSINKVSGLARASISKISSVALASVKKLAGLA